MANAFDLSSSACNKKADELCGLAARWQGEGMARLLPRVSCVLEEECARESLPEGSVQVAVGHDWIAFQLWPNGKDDDEVLKRLNVAFVKARGRLGNLIGVSFTPMESRSKPEVIIQVRKMAP